PASLGGSGKRLGSSLPKPSRSEQDVESAASASMTGQSDCMLRMFDVLSKNHAHGRPMDLAVAGALPHLSALVTAPALHGSALQERTRRGPEYRGPGFRYRDADRRARDSGYGRQGG